MRTLLRLLLLIALLTASALVTPNQPLAAQGEEEGPASFVPTERLPAGSAVSFPVDI